MALFNQSSSFDDGLKVRIFGMSEIAAELKALPEKLRKRAIAQALRAGARLVQREARLRTPVLKLSTYSGASAIRRGVRKPGTVRDAISVRTSKRARRRGDIGVFVNVKPAVGAKRGTYKPTDPFYWRWINWGRNAATRRFKQIGRRRRNGLMRRSMTGALSGARFLEAGASRLPQALPVISAQLAKSVAKLNQRRAPAP